jgi:hypothetical protein
MFLPQAYVDLFIWPEVFLHKIGDQPDKTSQQDKKQPL